MKTITTFKVLLLTALMFIGFRNSVMAQNRIEGLWLTEKKDAKVQIYKGNDGKYYGKIVWLKDGMKNGRPKTDENNSDKVQQKQPLLGLVILKGFEEDDDTYDDGTIYDPENGKTYDCKITFQGKKLSIRGYVGISLFGRTTVWEKAG